MAYDHNIEGVRNRLLSIVGASGASLTMPELWDRYLTAIGFTTGTLLDRQAKAAAAAGMTIAAYRRATTALGPELAPAVSTWVINGSPTGLTVDGTGIHFVNASNLATAGYESADIVNGAVYKVEVTIANVIAPNNGTWELRLYGTSNNNVAQNTNITLANGTSAAQYITANNAGTATTTAIRIRCSGTTGNNNFDVTSVSVKRVY